MAHVMNYCFTLQDMMTVPGNAAKAVYAAGFFAAAYPGESLAAFEPYPDLIGKLVVFAEEGLLAQLTEAERQAILLHEEAHIALGHLDQPNGGILNDPQIELDADRYAVERGADPAALLSSFDKIFQTMAARLTSLGHFRRTRYRLILLLIRLNKGHRQRVKALKAMV